LVGVCSSPIGSRSTKLGVKLGGLVSIFSKEKKKNIKIEKM
jgi:hypothetical protein